MRLEGQRQRGAAMRAADLERGGDDGPVTEVNAVEIAHRHHGPPGDRGRFGGVADDNKIGRHCWRSCKGISGCGRDRDVTSRAKSSRAEIEAFRQVYRVSRGGRLTRCLRADASGGGGMRGRQDCCKARC